MLSNNAMDWEFVDDQSSLERFLNRFAWEHISIHEILAHSSVVGERPTSRLGVNASGYNNLELRILYYISGDDFLEVVFDAAEFFTFEMRTSLNHSALKVDSLGRVESEQLRAARLRFRMLQRDSWPAPVPFYCEKDNWIHS